jgi:hypothetical protein
MGGETEDRTNVSDELATTLTIREIEIPESVLESAGAINEAE